MAASQPSFSDIEHESARRTTRRSEFLNIMEEIIVWDEWIELIRPHYYSDGGRGRPAKELETMLRMYLLQVWFTLSDVGCEEACIDSYAMHSFLKLKPGDEVPDATTLANFRHMMEQDRLGELLFSSLTKCLKDGGVMYKGGTIVDATFIESTYSTKNTSKKRDTEMHQAKKGKTWHHGMKLHIGVDAGTGLPHTLTTTSANIHDLDEAHRLIRDDDVVVYGDAGYRGIKNRAEVKDDEHLSAIDYRINEMRSKIKSDTDKAIENRKSSTRCKVEHVFHVIKDLFGLRKTPYRGLAKNTERLIWAVMSVSLYLLAMANRRIDGSPLFDTT
ncbi:MAG: IS5 family transposase [Coriobacteriales bacterium]|jgi:IS5 family transposase|nr:IS5 family transposase [Coriobacteriales bacterium]